MSCATIHTTPGKRSRARRRQRGRAYARGSASTGSVPTRRRSRPPLPTARQATRIDRPSPLAIRRARRVERLAYISRREPDRGGDSRAQSGPTPATAGATAAAPGTSRTPEPANPEPSGRRRRAAFVAVCRDSNSRGRIVKIKPPRVGPRPPRALTFVHECTLAECPRPPRRRAGSEPVTKW